MIYHRQPLNIIIEVTSRCNLRCVMCGYPHMTRAKADMDFDLYKGIIDECAAKGYNPMWLHHMGEPLLYPRICEAVEYKVKKIGRPPVISTNGMFLGDEMIKKLKAAGLQTIMICLSSMTKGAYERLRVGAKFETVVENTHKAIDAGFDVIVQSMDTVYTHREPGALYEAEFGPDRSGFRVERWPVNKFKPGGAYVGFNEPLKPSCHLLASHFVICQDGRVAICCFDYDCRCPVGDVNKQSIAEIAEYGFDEYVSRIRCREVGDMPPCCECLDPSWRKNYDEGRFVSEWPSCIGTT